MPDSPRLLLLAELTWREVAALDPSRTVAILPTGATEAHGPHLPLATDVIIADAMARDGGQRLIEAGYDVVLLPTLPYTAADFAAGFAGTVSVSTETETALIVDIGRSLARHGLHIFVFANAHLDPGHLSALTSAAARLESEYGLTVVFPNITRRPWAQRLGSEFMSGACHAGCFEGSVVMAERPSLVREVIRVTLPENPSSLSVAIRGGKQSFEEAGGPNAYFGAPAVASAEEGRETVGTLGVILAEAVLMRIGRVNVQAGPKAPM